MYEIYTDGAASNNGEKNNTGGFGVVVFQNGELIDYHCKGSTNTTNNREELKAILYATIKYGLNSPIVYSDSAYSVNTLNTWMHQWVNNNWLTSSKKEPKNLDLIQAYYDLTVNKGYNIILAKVKGHNNILGNELADQLAHLDTKKTLTFVKIYSIIIYII